MASRSRRRGGASLFGQRLGALCVKEFLQAIRDPSALFIVFILPPMLLALFAYGVSLDQGVLPLGVVQQGSSVRANSLASAFRADDDFTVRELSSRADAEAEMNAGRVKGYVIIPADVDQRLKEVLSNAPHARAVVQVITDGSQQTNTALLLANMVEGIVQLWLAQQGGRPPQVVLEPRFWYNPELDSLRILVPGSITIVMTMLATLLTALVISREWERGTMEALMSSPINGLTILLGKLVPYFLLSMVASLLITGLAILWFQLPFRGSFLALLFIYSSFLIPSLALGLLISSVARNQLLASMAALIAGFLPGLLLSGFIFEVSAMPWILRVLAAVIPATHLIRSLRTLFLVGDLWPMLLSDSAAMLALGVLLFIVAGRRSRKTLEV